ncbi:C-type lectin domain family 4 member M-like [Mastacembelus armatus]|uniref:C-type lectin domain family 4 member M-like n=1 Tax=Mastacembelus armatus TaxID=205130 RepID=UPI000E4630E3|nr:C-type lectin domain family 4 member M-like [Mastacembelus armatus]
MKISQNIYENVLIHSLEQDRTEPVLSGKGDDVKKSLCRAATVFLGLLCLLLLAGLTAVVVHFIQSKFKQERKMVLLQTSYNNLTKEMDQLQTSYNNLTEEMDQLQTSYNNLIGERNQLQTSYNNLIGERTQLQTSYNNLIGERDQLQTSYNNLIGERNQLQTSYNNLIGERDQWPMASYNKRREKSVQHPKGSKSQTTKSYTGEDNEVTAAMPGIKLQRCVAVSFGLLCILQAALNIWLRLTLCIDAKCNNLSDERDELKRIEIGNLTKERDELKRKLILQQISLTTERDDMTKKLTEFAHYSHQGWVYFNGSFYYVSTIKKTWQKSRDNCLLQNADLMIINSKEEMAFVRQFQKVTWIGLTDSDVEAVWKWVDGTLLTLSFWYSGEPNNYYGRNEDCVETNYYDSEDSWNDVNCENENFWVCEKKMAL